MVKRAMTGQPGSSWEERGVPLFDHGIAYLPGPNGRPVPRRDVTAVAPRPDPVDGRARRRACMDSVPPRSSSSPRARPTITAPTSPGPSTSARTAPAIHGRGAPLRRRRVLAPLEPQGEAEAGRSTWRTRSCRRGSPPSTSTRTSTSGRAPERPGAGEVQGVARHARREGRTWSSRSHRRRIHGSQIAPLPTRTLPVTLPSYFAPSQNRTLRAIAPAGMAWAISAGRRRQRR